MSKKRFVRCKDCGYFETDTGRLDCYKGVCRFNPPTTLNNENGIPIFPITFADQFCGMGVHNDDIDWGE